MRAALLVTAACALQPKLPTRTTTRRSTVRMAWNDAATCKVCFVRHGQSEWNAKNLFTGWADVPLTILGKNEAAAGATWIWKEGLEFDVAYTSELKRAQQTLKLVMDITGQNDLTVHKSWRLNERMYGALQGLNKKETVMKYGDDQVLIAASCGLSEIVRGRRDSPPSYEAVGGFDLDFERVSGKIATRYITHRYSCGGEASTRRRRPASWIASTGRATTTSTRTCRKRMCLARSA